jgi:hypothetical protein
MTLNQAGWLSIALEIILLMIWVYSAFFSKNTDAAGRGYATIYLLALTLYITIGIILMLINNSYCTIAVLVMAALPLLVVVYGIARKYS